MFRLKQPDVRIFEYINPQKYHKLYYAQIYLIIKE